MKIAFLDLSDASGEDANKATDALKQKYPKYNNGKTFKHLFGQVDNKIDTYRMIPLFRKFKANSLSVGDVKKVKEACKTANKVMLSIHGPLKSADYGICKGAQFDDGKGGKTDHVTWQELADFMARLLEKNRSYHLGLVMCFGARTSSYEDDHQDLSSIDWKDSFAFNFYKQICKKVSEQILMSARTGELSFNRVTGKSEVQTEDAIQATSEQELLNDLLEEFTSWYNNFQKDQIVNKGDFEDMIYTLESISNGVKGKFDVTTLNKLINEASLDNSTTAKELKSFLEYQKTSVEVGKRKQEVKGKYGKLMFSCSNRTITILAKYPSPTVVAQASL